MSGFLSGMSIAGSGLSAQRTRMNVVSSNLANAQTTRTEEGGAYRRRDPVFRAAQVSDFERELDSAFHGVRIVAIEPDMTTPMEMVYDPSHPDSNPDGYLELPNVNVVEEMVNMITASRSYEANATAFETLKQMAMRAVNIG